MNLWRRSKSWFQDGSSEHSYVYAGQPEQCFCLEQEKEMLEKRHETERKMLGKEYHRQLLEAKSKFDLEARRLEEKNALFNKNVTKDVAAAVDVPNNPNHVKLHSADFPALAKKDLMFEGDGLEWDPSDDLRSYDEDQIKDCSWEQQCEGSFHNGDSALLNGGQSEDVDLCDSAYSSRESRLSMEFQGKSIVEEEGREFLNDYQSYGDVHYRIEEARATVRQEVLQECEEKFRQERGFLYSIIDELEENVSLLRKQKEDIVTILESEGKETAKDEAGEVLK